MSISANLESPTPAPRAMGVSSPVGWLGEADGLCIGAGCVNRGFTLPAERDKCPQGELAPGREQHTGASGHTQGGSWGGRHLSHPRR